MGLMQQPSVGRVVHYVSRGSADGVFAPACRAAILTAVGPEDDADLCVFNPTGLYFDQGLKHNESKTPGTWHWPERVDD